MNSLLQQGVFVAKASLGDDTKLLHMSLNMNYADILAAVKSKFPTAGAPATRWARCCAPGRRF